MQNFHFISGLPRSGSTLLSAILKQNPRIHASMSSPVASLFSKILTEFSPKSQSYPLLDNECRRSLLRSIISAYYSQSTNKSVVFDTNRTWCARLPLLSDLFFKAKVVVCVRTVTDILNSFEHLFRENPLVISKMFFEEQYSNVYNRIDSLTTKDGVVGFAWKCLQEACYGEHVDNLLLVDYDRIVSNPIDVIRNIYDFIEEPIFEHNFENLCFDEGDSFDEHLGVPGLHTVRPRISLVRRPSVLPPDIMRRFAHHDFWRSDSDLRQRIRIA